MLSLRVLDFRVYKSLKMNFECLSPKRSRKTTPRQFEIMADFILQHKESMEGKLSSKLTAKDKDSLWEELASLLNADGFGPQKSTDKWRKVSKFLFLLVTKYFS